MREVLGSKPGELAGEAVPPRVRRAARVSPFLRLAPRARVGRVHAQSFQAGSASVRRRRARSVSLVLARSARDRTADLSLAGPAENRTSSDGSRRAGSEFRAGHGERGVARRDVHGGETPSAAGGHRGEPRDRGSIDGGRVAAGARREARLCVIPERVQATGRAGRDRHRSNVSFGESGRTACRPTLDHEPVLSARTDSNARLRPRSPGGARRATARVRSGVARPTSGRQSRKRQLFTSVVMFRISRNRSPGRQRSSTPFWHGPGNWETPQRRRSPHPRARAPPVVGAQPRTHTRGSAPPRRRRWRASTVAPRASRCRMRIPF